MQDLLRAGAAGLGGEVGQRAEDLAGVLDVVRADALPQPRVDPVDRRADDGGRGRAVLGEGDGQPPACLDTASSVMTWLSCAPWRALAART
jgi:ParB-like chromosome segregation protein Spo0J